MSVCGMPRAETRSAKQQGGVRPPEASIENIRVIMKDGKIYKNTL